ncbi:four helix bundle protein [Desulfosediminicola flagellatus]|uniref:four helix bundle protein n=1 Tax=Desulfosediminicola flagellatus TaxID=2569541 RepID=UPI0010ACDF37|nr:four helix bundle protein [Desulfosediminicola flagellatus]
MDGKSDSSVRRHHNLLVWQEGINLVTTIYRLTSAFPPEEKYGLVSQMRRAAVSIPSNIAEGAARTTQKEFSHFLSIARGSLSELETQLIICRKLEYVSDVDETFKLMNKIFALLGGLIKSLNGNNTK